MGNELLEGSNHITIFRDISFSDSWNYFCNTAYDDRSDVLGGDCRCRLRGIPEDSKLFIHMPDDLLLHSEILR